MPLGALPLGLSGRESEPEPGLPLGLLESDLLESVASDEVSPLVVSSVASSEAVSLSEVSPS